MKKLAYFGMAASLFALLSIGLLIGCSEQATDAPTAPTENSTALSKAPLSGTASSPISNQGITPYIIAGSSPGGNRTCSEVATAYGVTFEYSSARVNYSGGVFDAAFPEGFTINVTGGTYVSWSFSKTGWKLCGLAVIVKGGNDANVYVYDATTEAYQSDAGLASHPNSSGDPAGLSNLTFCWNECPVEVEECWEGETAWTAGSRYTTRGNWATYTSYEGSEKTVTLFAGQTLNAGTVKFEPNNGGVKITICLNDGWRFAVEDENVKIQDYASAPSGNPAPGRFAHKGNATGTCFSIDVPLNNFYGVHVDVERRVSCP